MTDLGFGLMVRRIFSASRIFNRTVNLANCPRHPFGLNVNVTKQVRKRRHPICIPMNKPAINRPTLNDSDPRTPPRLRPRPESTKFRAKVRHPCHYSVPNARTHTLTGNSADLTQRGNKWSVTAGNNVTMIRGQTMIMTPRVVAINGILIGIIFAAELGVNPIGNSGKVPIFATLLIPGPRHVTGFIRHYPGPTTQYWTGVLATSDRPRMEPTTVKKGGPRVINVTNNTKG